MTINGIVEKRVICKGSKSERDAVVLVQGAHAYVLRRVGGNPFGDPELDKLVGKTIKADGALHGPVFIMMSWE